MAELLIKSISENPKYKAGVQIMERIRDAVRGQDFVKAKGERYLRPSHELTSDPILARNRYVKYLEGAVFDGFTGQTMRALVGRLSADKMQIDVDAGIDYIINDIDNDGTTAESFIEQIAAEVLQLKWCIGVADYQGVTDLDAEHVSIADLEQIDARATIKLYARDNVVDWDFQRINGRMQLSFLLLREVSSVLDKEALTRKDVVSYIILALDENGEYYQQKLTQSEVKGGAYIKSDKSYPIVNGARLEWLPVYIFSDEALSSGKMPDSYGMLSPIADIAFDKYRVSADQKEAIRYLAPTTYIMGMDAADMDIFEQANGRKHIETGAGCVNIIPGDARVEIVGAATAVEHFAQYLDTQDRKVRALGGVFKTSQEAQRTATEASINNAEQNATLAGLDYSLRTGMKKLLAYCAMFEGLTQSENVEDYARDNIVIESNVDYGKTKLQPDEVRSINELYREGVIDLEELLQQLSSGGRLVADPEELASRLSNNGFLPTEPVAQLTNRGSADNVIE